MVTTTSNAARHCSRLVFEVTGVCHRQLETSLSKQKFPFAQGNLCQVPRFGEGTGRLVEMDRANAVMLAMAGALPEMKTDELKCDILYNLKGMTAGHGLNSRQGLGLQLHHARCSGSGTPLCLHHFERDFAKTGATIEAITTPDKWLCEHAGIPVSISGMAMITAFSMLVKMPELGSSDEKRAPGLAGFASISRPSENGRGKECIQLGAPVCEGRSASCGRHPFQPGYESKISRADRQREMSGTCDFQRSCASLWSWQMRCCMMAVNRPKHGLERCGYSAILRY